MSQQPSPKNVTELRPRTWMRLDADTKERVGYWADRHQQSVNEYMAEAVEEKIARENHDYDLPTLEIARVNQLTDEVKTLSTNVANLELVLVKGFDTLLGLVRGSNYLLENEDGELS